MKNKFLTILALFFSVLNYGQVLQPFNIIFSKTLNGDFDIIGNNILSVHQTSAYNGSGMNHYRVMVNVDIDADPTTYASSSAVYQLPNNARNCSKIKKAYLYWSATYEGTDRSNIYKVKFKVPGTTTYIDIEGQLIYDSVVTNTISSKPYASYADVTPYINASNPEGNYTVANVVASTGLHQASGYSAGWSLYLIYENPLLTKKNITLFNGFIANLGEQSINYSLQGILTPRTGPVNATFGMCALEGDLGIIGDRLNINNNPLSLTSRQSDNLFCSSITNTSGSFTNRFPSSQNTLGFDIAKGFISNPANSVIYNSTSSIDMKSIDQGDVYFIFSNALAFEYHEPKLYVLDKLKDLYGIDVTGDLQLGQKYTRELELVYKGNDILDKLVLKTILPLNILPPSNFNLPTGFTSTYNSATRELVFTLTKEYYFNSSPKITFDFELSPFCENYKDACSNQIANMTFASYRGSLSQIEIINEPSSSAYADCGLPNNLPSRYTVNVENCNYTSSVLLCDKNQPIVLDPKVDGYNSYSWHDINNNTIANSKTLTVNQAGTYIVECTSANCNKLTQTFNVSCNPNLMISQEGNALKANLTSNNYTWMDCDNANTTIVGENNQYFTPQQSGNYAVSMLNDVGETLTSSCFNYTFLNSEKFNSTEFKVYPMPVQNELSIDGLSNETVAIEILNVLGQKMMSFDKKQDKYNIDGLTKGNYLLKIKNGNSVSNYHLIKL
ncbi:T9SS type A sorting domain-containing protein [Flavobacterium sp.]|uniref:T9SS type A sorting domain-containing protein n=1 Tax=Flavobacterium sp. TaxID=239 RepID=UPI003D0AB489